MKFIPILYAPPMVQATLEYRKTMTRRLKGLEAINQFPDKWTLNSLWANKDLHAVFDRKEGFKVKEVKKIKCPYGKRGDVLWVRENYHIYNNSGGRQIYITTESEVATFRTYEYEELSTAVLARVMELEPNKSISRPSIFLFKDFCRIFLEITSIRVERLHDISPGDAADEGINCINVDLVSEEGAVHADYENYMWRDDESYKDYYFPYYADPISSFKSLWYKINGVKSWDANPFVWVITFKKIERPENFLIN